ncbi:MAG: trypsin-like peptidase domain-containing protein [Candidatus Eisenbacteria bacterium]|nr:trypsin-like peptidase domain-containing protein [Candidatus Eisenbacteria bacterium]
MRFLRFLFPLFLGILIGIAGTLTTAKEFPRASLSGGETQVAFLGASSAGQELSPLRKSPATEAARKVGPSVVTISVTQLVSTSPFQTRFGDDFFDQFFRDFYAPWEFKREISNMGSGFIIHEDGYILTNEHVVANAQKVNVTLTDGRQFDANVVASDSNYDLALLKINGKNLPAAPIGDSDGIVVGEWAIAIGNPFGYLLNDSQPTVTAGIVSAVHRSIKPGGAAGIYKDMIQTNADINPGNSGGPLANGDGEVIGVNTFIFSGSGGSVGIGFAIPINVAKRVLDEFIKFGKVRPVWIGIHVWEISPYLASRFNITDREGLIVSSLERGSPADRAGLKIGDLIRKVDGEKTRTSEDAARSIFGKKIGDTLLFEIERDGKRKEIKLVLEEAPEQN